MFELTIAGVESFDSETNMFVTSDSVVVRMEHSLASLSKWESSWGKPFLGDSKKTSEEVCGYLQAMSLDGPIPDELLLRLTEENFREINEYIELPMTATWFAPKGDQGHSRNSEVVTAEIIYHWMVSQNLPFECEHWHLNRLITLIKVINEKNHEMQKRSEKPTAPTRSDLDRRRALNASRRAQSNTNG